MYHIPRLVSVTTSRLRVRNSMFSNSMSSVISKSNNNKKVIKSKKSTLNFDSLFENG